MKTSACFADVRIAAASIAFATIVSCAAVPAGPAPAGSGAGGPAPAPKAAPGRAVVAEERRELAKLYLRLGETYFNDFQDKERAREYFVRYLETLPEGEGAELARRRLREMGYAAPSETPSPGSVAVSPPPGPARSTAAPGPPQAPALAPPALPQEASSPGTLGRLPAATKLVPVELPERTVRAEVAESVSVLGLQPKDFSGQPVQLVQPGTEGTIVLLWKSMDEITLDLLKELARYGKENRWYRPVSAAATGSATLIGYLRDKGMEFPLVDDTEGTLAARLGVGTYPSLAILNSRGRLVGLVRDWDGSGLVDLIRDAEAGRLAPTP